MELLVKVKGVFDDGLWVKDGEWTGAEIEKLNTYLFLTAKPVVYIINVSEANYIKKQNKYLVKIKEWIDAHGGGVMIPFSAEYETRVVELGATDPESRQKICKEEGTPSAINKIMKTGYQVLSLVHYFTCGEDEVRQWTVRKGSLAPRAAGVIHTDFEKGFICADQFHYDDLIEHGDEKTLKKEGL